LKTLRCDAFCLRKSRRAYLDTSASAPCEAAPAAKGGRGTTKRANAQDSSPAPLHNFQYSWLFISTTINCMFERFPGVTMGAPVARKAGTTGFAFRWYVTFERASEWRPCSSRAPSSRNTKSFQNEIEAKSFARSMLSDGFSVTAGTLNPHRPKRRIPASEIDQWLDDSSRQTVSRIDPP
jgi:hypothetical protein